MSENNTGINGSISNEERAVKWINARRLFAAYNQLPYDDLTGRENILKQLLGKCPNIIDIQSPFYCDYGFNISIGEHTFINFNCII